MARDKEREGNVRKKKNKCEKRKESAEKNITLSKKAYIVYKPLKTANE